MFHARSFGRDAPSRMTRGFVASKDSARHSRTSISEVKNLARKLNKKVSFPLYRVVEDVDPYDLGGLILIICSHFDINMAIVGL